MKMPFSPSIDAGFKRELLAMIGAVLFVIHSVAATSPRSIDALFRADSSNLPVAPFSPLVDPTTMKTASVDLDAALAHYQAGDFALAAEKAGSAATLLPDSPIAYQLLGGSRLRLGHFEAGIDSLQTALRLAPQSIEIPSILAHAFLERGNLNEARKYFLMILERKADNPGAHHGLGLISEREEKFDEAALHFENATKEMAAGTLGAKVNLGATYNRLRKFDKTIALLSGAVANATSLNVSAVEILGTAYLGAGNPSQAIATFNLAYPSSPSAPLAFGLGMSYRALHRPADALKYFKEATDSKANWPEAWVQLSEAQIALSEYPGALQSLEKARAFTTEPAPIDSRVGDVHLLTKDYAKAIAIFKRLAEAHPADLGLTERLGSAYQASGDVAAAERTFKSASNKFPAAPLPPYKLGLLYTSLKRHSDATAAFMQAAALDADNLVLQRAIITSYATAGDKRSAIEVAHRLMTKNPALTEPKLILAALYSQSGDDRPAIEIYREILQTTPNDVVALNNLAMSLSRSGELDEALRHSQRAVSLIPKSGQLLDTLGWLKYQKGNHSEAVTLLKKASELSPGDASILYHLGMAYAKLNEKSAALHAFKSAVSVSRDFAEHEQTLKMIAALGGSF